VKIGILSDTHNRKNNIEIALAAFRERGITTLIHCGDVTSAETVLLFAGWDVTFVLGNIDLERNDLITATQMIGVSPPLPSRSLEIDGQRIGVTHGHDYNLLFGMVMSGKYAYVCHGHTHRRRNELRDGYAVRLINPGALGGSQHETRSVCLLDVETGAVEFVEFPEMF
jgi:putative phosphoesterase